MSSEQQSQGLVSKSNNGTTNKGMYETTRLSLIPTDIDIIPGSAQKSKGCGRCHMKKIWCIFPTGEPICQQCKQHGIEVCFILDAPMGKQNTCGSSVPHSKGQKCSSSRTQTGAAEDSAEEPPSPAHKHRAKWQCQTCQPKAATPKSNTQADIPDVHAAKQLEPIPEIEYDYSAYDEDQPTFSFPGDHGSAMYSTSDAVFSSLTEHQLDKEENFDLDVVDSSGGDLDSDLSDHNDSDGTLNTKIQQCLAGTQPKPKAPHEKQLGKQAGCRSYDPETCCKFWSSYPTTHYFLHTYNIL